MNIGQLPLFSTSASNLRFAYLHSNQFSASIPEIAGKMNSLVELFLFNNRLIGNLPSSLGLLRNLTKLSVSYNSLKGTIPSTIGQLNKLNLLHLHGNQMEGFADHFTHQIPENFISDCGNTAETISLVTCATCSICCNQDEDCIDQKEAWPKELKKMNSTLGLSSVESIFLIMLAFLIFLLAIGIYLRFVKDYLPAVSIYSFDEFQPDSIYRFFLGSQTRPRIIAFLTTAFQICITYTFFRSGDITSPINDWVFSVR